MKKNPFYCLLLIVLFGCAPKLSTSGHYQNLAKVMENTSKGNYGILGETMPTDFWLVYNKENYIKKFEEIGQKTGPVTITNLKISNVSDPIKSNGKYFQIVNYSTEMEMNTSNLSAQIIDQYKSTFGAENLKLDPINNRLYIQNESHMLAVYEEESNQWKYMEINLPIVTKVFGLETTLELEEYVR